MKLTFSGTTKTRLDHFLREHIADLSRTKIQNLIESGAVTVDGEEVAAHHWLKGGEVIEYTAAEVKELAKEKKFKPNKDIALDIVFETDDYAIINKPAGLLVHPTDGMEHDTLANALVAHWPKIKKVGDDEKRPGIVHRLDKDVSGLMVICKTQRAFDHFKTEFQSRRVKKIYTALVHDPINQPTGTLNFKIERGSRGRMAARPETQEGKEAITHYTVTRDFKNFSLVRVEIETGRSNQIRAHFNAFNHPVAGDKVYTQKSLKETVPLARVFLHSTILGFTDPDGAAKEFTAPLPPELETVLESLQ